jgi:8-oxo-dGTP pyrophosphatase MutT (NUDIX family)
MAKSHPPITVTDEYDRPLHPEGPYEVHSRGLPHRVIHAEIIDPAGRWFAWRRKGGRLEIPGGHVDWLTQFDRSETYEEAALRELIEELNLERNWQMSFGLACDRLRPHLTQVGRYINQLPSTHGPNNEWLGVFHLRWQTADWGDPAGYSHFGDGSKEPEWLHLDDIVRRGMNRKLEFNAALHLFLQRRGIMAPYHEAVRQTEKL